MGVTIGPRRVLTPKELLAARRRIERLERRPGRVIDIDADSRNGHRTTRD